jgi:hypothetical protein
LAFSGRFVCDTTGHLIVGRNLCTLVIVQIIVIGADGANLFGLVFGTVLNSCWVLTTFTRIQVEEVAIGTSRASVSVDQVLRTEGHWVDFFTDIDLVLGGQKEVGFASLAHERVEVVLGAVVVLVRDRVAFRVVVSVLGSVFLDQSVSVETLGALLLVPWDVGVVHDFAASRDAMVRVPRDNALGVENRVSVGIF